MHLSKRFNRLEISCSTHRSFDLSFHILSDFWRYKGLKHPQNCSFFDMWISLMFIEFGIQLYVDTKKQYEQRIEERRKANYMEFRQFNPFSKGEQG